MGFTWTTISVGELVKASHLNEIYDAVNTVTSALGVAMRDAIDYAYDNNQCSAHNSGYDVTIDANDYVTVDSVDYGADDSSADNGYDSNYDSTIDSTDRVTYYSDNDAGVDSTYHSSYRNNENTRVEVNEHTGYNGNEHGWYTVGA